MARNRTKGKKVRLAAGGGRRTRKGVKKPHKPASKTSPTKPESPETIDLLRSWSPSRYATR